MPHDLYLFLLGAGGAAAAELLKLYELRGKLSHAKYRRIATSKVFWSVLLGMLASSGFIAWAVNEGADAVSALQVIMSGIGANGIIRRAAEGQSANAPLAAGVADDATIELHDLFR